MGVTKKDGKWIAKGTVCLPSGERRYYNRQFDLKKDAVAWEAKRREELNNESPSMTFGRFFREQTERDRMRIKASTIFSRENHYKVVIGPAFENTPLSTITPLQVQKWYDKIIIDRNYKYTTANERLDTLSVYLNEAVRLGLIDSNPANKVKRIHTDPNKFEEVADNFWTIEDYEEFITKFPDFYYINVIMFLWATGVRIGECQALQWKHYDGENIRIIQTVGRHINTITKPKTANSVRTVILNKKTIELIDGIKEKQSKIDGWNEDWYIFGSYKPMHYSAVATAFRRTLRRNPEIKYVTLHGLRHSHASLLINNGISDMVIADRLGHTVEQLHRTYAHLYESTKSDLKDSLEKLL